MTINCENCNKEIIVNLKGKTKVYEYLRVNGWAVSTYGIIYFRCPECRLKRQRLKSR